MTNKSRAWLQAIFLAPLNTTIPSCEALNVLNDEKAFEVTPSEPNKSDSPLALNYLFSNLDIPSVDDRKTPPCPQVPSFSWIDTLWDPSPPSPKHDPNSPKTSNIHIYTCHTDDDIPSNFAKTPSWDQHGPSIIEQSKDKDIMIHNHQEEGSMEKNTLAYLGKSILSSHFKKKRKKNIKAKSLLI